MRPGPPRSNQARFPVECRGTAPTVRGPIELDGECKAETCLDSMARALAANPEIRELEMWAPDGTRWTWRAPGWAPEGARGWYLNG